MQKELSFEEGAEAVKLARKSIEYYSATGSRWREKAGNDKFLKERGVFVTIEEYPSMELRGCIGFPYASKQLWEAIIEASIEAAFHDPRFLPLKAEELEKILVEISVLTQPKEITGKKSELHEKIEIGKDGLIIQRGHRSGLLLPQVAVEQKWDSEEFLRECCKKAFIPEAAWQSAETKIFRFQAQIFSERTPGGQIEEK